MKEALLYTLPFVILTVLAFAIYYVSRRLAWAFSFNSTATLVISAIYVVLCLIALVLIMRGNYISGLSHLINNVATISLGVFALLFCSLVVVDVVQVVAKLQPLTFGLIWLSLTLISSGYSLFNAQNIKVIHRDIELPNLEIPLRIAQLTDIHIGHYSGKKTIEKIVDKVLKESVDAVVITGDMFDGRVGLNSEVLEPFKKITVPIFFVEGNHDGYSGSRDIKNLLRDNGIKVLSNEIVEFKGLQIVGLDYLTPDSESIERFHAAPTSLTMKEVLPTLGIAKDKAAVLLHHNPVGASYAAENGINLYLAGHTHAGQMFPSTLVAKLMFEYNKGLYEYNDSMQIYVSQGVGTFGPPMRLGTNSEITILNLK